MTDKPIIFSAPMVRALIEGRKTQTRRVITSARAIATPGCPAYTLRGDDLTRALQNASDFGRIDGTLWQWEADAFEWQLPHARTFWFARLPYAPGDRLWVREAWKSDRAYDDLAPSEMGGEEPLIYMADNDVQRWGWKPDVLSRWGRYRHARFMPRWASRLTLTVTDVRVQRLQEISEADAMAEGVMPDRGGGGMAGMYSPLGRDPFAYARGFRDLWNSLHGPDAWDANPWVCALTFTVERRNIDA